jgi:hypothetical protein
MSELDEPGALRKKRRKRKPGDLYAGEAQRDLGLSLGDGGLLGRTDERRSLFG